MVMLISLLGLTNPTPVSDPMVTLSGTVTDAVTGVGIENIYVDVWNTDFSYFAFAYTNDVGFYSMEIQPGTYVVNLYGGYDYFNASEEVTVTTSATFNISMTPKVYGSISGTVTDIDNGDPVASAYISLYSNDPFVYGWVYSNQDGSYQVNMPAIAGYHMSFSAEGYSQTQIKDVDVEEGEDTVVNVFMNRTRVSGTNRYHTAVQISKMGWSIGADTVLLARGDDYADALAGVSLAYQLNAPILLTRSDRLIESTRDEILRLGATRVILLGSEVAMSNEVKQALLNDPSLNVTEVDRIGGANRFDTAARIADRLVTERGLTVVPTAFIAYSHNFPDALAVASYAAVQGYPILLTRTDQVSQHTINALSNLGVENVIAVGSFAVISDEVLNGLPVSGSRQRIAGENRYATAVALAEAFLPATQKQVYVATGLNFADAIAGAVLAAKRDSGVLLVRGDRDEVNQVVQGFCNDQGIHSVNIFGGATAVSSDIEAWFKDNL